jgi:type IV secretory pathway TraG/TraD family ATPase VirD4
VRPDAVSCGGRTLGQKVYRFDPLQEAGRTHGFNVLAYVRDGDLRVTDVQTVAAILVPNESHDPSWDHLARDLLVGLILLVLEAGPALGWPVTVGQVHRLIRSEEETGEYLKALRYAKRRRDRDRMLRYIRLIQ